MVPNTFASNATGSGIVPSIVHVGIVGGGVTGLALCRALHERDVECTVFEADDRPGGVVRSRRVDGRVLDLGPQRTRRTPAVADLLADLDLESRAIEAAELPLTVYHDGRLRRVPRSLREALGTDLLSWRGKLRALAEPLADPPRERETVDGYLRRAFGPEVAERLGGPLYSGLYGSDPDEMYVEYTLGRALDRLGVSGSVLTTALRRAVEGFDPPPAITFEDGMAELPRALADRYAERVRLSTPVEAVLPDEDGYAVRVAPDPDAGSWGGASPRERRRGPFDAVVLTTPAGVTADVVEGVAPDSAAALRRISYNPLAVVHLHSSVDFEVAGFQTSIPERDRTVTRGVTANAALFDRDGVYTAYLGGADRPEVVEWSDRRLGRVAAREFESVTGESASPIAVNRVRPGMPAFDTSWPALAEVDLPAGLVLCTNYTDRAGIPGRIRQAERLAERIATGEVPTGVAPDSIAAAG